MTYIPPWQRLCDCRCIVHHHQPRTAYNHPDCACTITCTTQPLTLLADPWNCALFLDSNGNLWQVPTIANGTFDWAYATEVDTCSDRHHACRIIEQLLRQAAHVLATPTD